MTVTSTGVAETNQLLSKCGGAGVEGGGEKEVWS